MSISIYDKTDFDLKRTPGHRAALEGVSDCRCSSLRCGAPLSIAGQGLSVGVGAGETNLCSRLNRSARHGSAVQQ